MASKKGDSETARETNWMKQLYEINERDLTPGSEFMLSLGARKAGARKPRKRGSRKQGAAGLYLSKAVSPEEDQG